MALINCPACNQKISDQYDTCPHCTTPIKATGGNAENIARKTESQIRLAQMKQTYSLQMQAMAGVVLFLLGIFLWYFVGKQGFSKLSHFIELTMAGVGAIWYLVTRVKIIARKSK